MRNLLLKLTSFLLLVIMVSCSTSNDVVQNGWITKRKHRKGFYVNKAPLKIFKNQKVEPSQAIPEERDEALDSALVWVGGESAEKDKSIEVNSKKNRLKGKLLEYMQSKEEPPLEINPNSKQDAVHTASIESSAPSKEKIVKNVRFRSYLALTISILTFLLNALNAWGGLFLPIVLANFWPIFGLTLLGVILTIIVAWPVRKRNDAAKWALRILWLILAFNILSSGVKFLIGVALLV